MNSTTHGHVIPNPDGSRARCGGPAQHCRLCELDQTMLEARSGQLHKKCREFWTSLAPEVRRGVTMHGEDAHYEQARLALFREWFPGSADPPTPAVASSFSAPGGNVQSADEDEVDGLAEEDQWVARVDRADQISRFQSYLSIGADPETAQPLPSPDWDLDSARPQMVANNVRTKVAAGVYVLQATGRTASLNEPVFRVEVESPPPPRPDRMTTEVEKRLFLILAEHDTDVWIRNADRTQSFWPDLSDIHEETRRKILDLMKIKDVLDRQDQADLPLDLTAVSDYRVRGQQAFSIQPPEEPIDASGYVNQIVLINGKRYRVTNVERHPVNERVNRLPFGLLVIPA